MAAALGRLAARRLGGSTLRRTAVLPRRTHTEAVTIGKEGELKRMQEKKEELYDLMVAADNKGHMTTKRDMRLLAELTAHVGRDDADWAAYRVIRGFVDFWVATGAGLSRGVFYAGLSVPVAHAVVWLSYACSSEYEKEPEKDPSAGCLATDA